jgi:hypothetical protein
MASINSKISKTDYNNIQTVINRVLGVGSGNSGYGQPVQSAQVTESDSVTVNEYAELRYDIINAYKHLNNAAPSDVDVKVEGQTIRYDGAPPDAEPIDYWQTVVDAIDAARLTLAVAGQRVTINNTVSPKEFTGSWGASAPLPSPNPQLSASVICEWTTAAKARHFFNAGGSIQFTSTRTGGPTTVQNTSWTNLLSSASTRIFGGNTPGTGTAPANGANYFRLTSTQQTWSSVIASSPYALNEWRIQCGTDDAVANNSTGASRRIRFNIFWIDDHFPLGGPSATGSPTQPSLGFGPDTVSGTISLTVQTIKASGVLEPTGIGNFEIEIPTVTVSNITNP